MRLLVKMKWFCKTFQELSLNEFHQILRLRIDVFVVEQNCAYHELDGKDEKAYHLFACDENCNNKLVAYSRIFNIGAYYNEAAFGRVVVDPSYRDRKLGYELVKRSIVFIEDEFNTSTVKISAQTYLNKFYESFGFKQIDSAYLEDGIPHIDMLKH